MLSSESFSGELVEGFFTVPKSNSFSLESFSKFVRTGAGFRMPSRRRCPESSAVGKRRLAKRRLALGGPFLGFVDFLATEKLI